MAHETCRCGQVIHHPPPEQAARLGVEPDGWVHAVGMRVLCPSGRTVATPRGYDLPVDPYRPVQPTE